MRRPAAAAAALFLWAQAAPQASPAPPTTPAKKKSTLSLNWRAVPGAAGYRFQVRRLGARGNRIDRRLKRPRVRFSLPPGRYEQRVGALDVFGRASWSPWRTFQVRAIGRQRQPRAGGQTAARPWSRHLPGFPQYGRGERIRGGALMAGTSLAALLTVFYYRESRSIAREWQSDMVVNLFTDPLLYLGARSFLREDSAQAAGVTLLAHNSAERFERSFRRSLQNAQLLLIATVCLTAFHQYDLRRLAEVPRRKGARVTLDYGPAGGVRLGLTFAF